MIDVVANEPGLPGGPLLDVGCGYGPIGLALAKRFPTRQITMSDVNERALGLAKRNAEANQLTNVTVVESSIYQQIPGQFGVIVTNPPIRAGKATVSAILAGAADHLLPGGQLYCVIQKKQGAPSALNLMQETFASAEKVKMQHGYYIHLACDQVRRSHGRSDSGTIHERGAQ